MSLDCDVALLGTGVAPLIAANELIHKGKRVFLINPDLDYFREDSDLSVDPFLVFGWEGVDSSRLQYNQPQPALDILRPIFPGAVEYSDAHQQSKGYRDIEAPHVRARTRVWAKSNRAMTNEVYQNYWGEVEEMFIQASEAQMNPLEESGVRLTSLIPGYNAQRPEPPVGSKGIALPKIVDTDVVRYRNGLLEYLREKVPKNDLVCAAHHIEFIPEGIRFYLGKVQKTVKIRDGFMAFWTPKLTRWMMSQLGSRMKKNEIQAVSPKNLRILEEWSLLSREPLRADTICVYEDMLLWADIEGPISPETESRNLKVLRVANSIELDQLYQVSAATGWATTQSFESLTRLCQEFLGWDKFTVRAMKPRVFFDWSTASLDQEVHFDAGSFEVEVVRNCEGALPWVARHSKQAVEKFV